MSVATNVVKRPGSTVFYARVEVPTDVQPLLKKTQLWKSLGTRDPREARARALPVLSAWQAQFDDLRRRRDPTAHDLQAAVWQHYEDMLVADQRERASLPDQHDLTTAKDKLAADIAAKKVVWTDDPMVQLNATLEFRALHGKADFLKSNRAHRLELLKKHLASGETALIQWAADDLIERERLIIDRGSPAYRDLCHKLQRAELEYLRRAAERDEGVFTGVPSDPVVVPPDATMGKKRAVAGQTIMELYDLFQTEKAGTASADTWFSNRKLVKLLAEFIGETSHVTAITKKAVRDWKHNLASWPL
ncbi:MAG: Site-specific recombinase XerD, partial [Hyphomicrobiales bacterium]|nr:Site-specific recombinase XerD [Hyphomicrobiales bacterium]